MNKQICDCYCITEKKEARYDMLGNFSHYLIKKVGQCWGTKECDECNCGGDRTKCDFYTENRTQSKKLGDKDKSYILNTILQEVKPLKLREKIYWRIVEFINKREQENG